MQFIRQKNFLSLLWLVMAIQVLNFSLNTQETFSKSVAESLCYDDLYEGDEPFINSDIDFFIHDNLVTLKKLSHSSNINFFSEFEEQYNSGFYPDICPPPPKA